METEEGGAPHEALIQDQFTRQAEGFARSRELHDAAQLQLLVDAARPGPTDHSLDVACGPGTVVLAFAGHVRLASGLDATPAMLEQAQRLARERGVDNVDWWEGNAYELPFPDGSLDIVSCRFAFHHLERPEVALAEMVRVSRPGGRVVLCDGLAPEDPRGAAAFNAMERHRDPSTVEFRPLSRLVEWVTDAGLSAPSTVLFNVSVERERLIAGAFPLNDDREALAAMVDALIEQDTLEVGTGPAGRFFIYPAAVISAVKAR